MRVQAEQAASTVDRFGLIVKIACSMNSFLTFKMAGTDGINPIMLQQLK